MYDLPLTKYWAIDPRFPKRAYTNWFEYAQKCEQNRRRSPCKIWNDLITDTLNRADVNGRFAIETLAIKNTKKTITILIESLNKYKYLYKKLAKNTRDNNGTMRGVLYNYVHKNKSNKVPGYI